MMITSAFANKMIRKLEEDKAYLRTKENECSCYVAALDEEPVVPEYDFDKVNNEIAEIDSKISKIRHAVNLANVTNTVDVDGEAMTIDSILISMAQLNNRKLALNELRRREPKVRISSGRIGMRQSAPEYQYINYDLDRAKSEYEMVDRKISAMQLALDKYNQTVEFEVEI